MPRNACTDFLSKAGIYSGVEAYHTFIVMKDGSVFGLGANVSGQLGLGDTKNRKEPSKVPFFEQNGEILKQIACGSYHSLFLASSGQLYSCGSNKDRELGLMDKRSRNIPQRVILFSGIEMIQICCGMGCNYCLANVGALYSFGWNWCGQLGDGTTEECETFAHVKIPANEKIIRVSAGYYHAAAMCESGSIYTWGDNSNYQLGRPGITIVPTIVDDLPKKKKPKQVICGGRHTTVIYSGNKVYSFGQNDFGQLGIDSTYNQRNPVRVDWFHNHPIRMMSTGGLHTVCILETGELVAYGYNASYQLFLNDTRNRETPTESTSFEIDSSNIIFVACGSSHTLLLTEDGSCYGIGSKTALGSDHDINEPIKFISGVDVGEDWLPMDLVSYAMDEQNIDEESDRTTDFVLKFSNDDVICINKALLEVRCEISKNQDNIENVSLSSGVKTRILEYLYGNKFENPPLDEDVNAILNMKRISLEYSMEMLFNRRNDDGDAIFVSKTEENDIHKAHKFVLVARSPYFRSVFRGGFRESIESKIVLDMHLNGDFEAYLRYLYTGYLDLNFPGVIKFADYFGCNRDVQLKIMRRRYVL